MTETVLKLIGFVACIIVALLIHAIWKERK